MMIIYNNSTLARLVRCCLCALRWCLHSITREAQEAVFSPVFPVFILVFCSRSCIFPCLTCISCCILVQKLYLSLSFLYLFLHFVPEVVCIHVFPVFLLVFWSRSCIYPCLSCISCCIFSFWISSKGFYSFFPAGKFLNQKYQNLDKRSKVFLLFLFPFPSIMMSPSFSKVFTVHKVFSRKQKLLRRQYLSSQLRALHPAL